MRIEEALQNGMAVRKEERFYAIDLQGVHHALYPEWALYYACNWKRMPKRKKKRTRSKGGSE